MRRLLAIVTLAGLATTGCAHKQLTNQQVAKYTVTGGAAAIAVGMTLYWGYRATVDPPTQPTYQPQ